MIVESFLAFLGKIFCFTSYIKSNGSFPKPLEPEEEKECLAKMREGDVKAREKLIRHNLRLVAHVVKKYSGAGEADDLISVGSIGLIKGIQSFEYGKGSQLATYVARCIENEILMYIRANKKHKRNVSLSDTVGSDKEGNEIQLIDILKIDSDPIVEEVENRMIMDKVMTVVNTALGEREREIIMLRYGLGGKLPHTQFEVAQKLDISRSYVSRIEKKALEKISHKVRD